MHLTASPVDWYAARAAGVVAYVLLTAVVCLGLAMSGDRATARWPRFAIEEVHRFGGRLVGAFSGVHLVTIAIDSYLRFSPAALVVPFASSYRPLPIALGVVAGELLLALAVVNTLRPRLPYRTWRLAHSANFAVWAAATVHGLTAGTDRSTWWLASLQAVAVAAVTGLTAARLGLRGRGSVGVAGVGAVAALLLGLVVFSYHPRSWNARTFTDRLAGTVSRQAGPSRELVSVVGTGTGAQSALLRADLLVEPQGLLATSFQLEFLPSGLRCTGTVTRVDALGFEGRCLAADGTSRVVEASWTAGAGPAFTDGTLDVHA